MSAAMMMPTFVPTLRVFLDLGHAGAARPVEALALLLGYVAIWVAGSLLGAVAQRFLAGLNLVAADGSSLSLWLTAALLLGAGLYQFTSAKAACLAKCRMPLTYFLENWSPGLRRSLRMGLHLGAYCLGCCWALMALAFVGGTMNLIWMGAATLFMVLEKLPEIGKPLTLPAGVLLLASSGLVTVMALTS
jgi:predicted metal-binding membrane protein